MQFTAQQLDRAAGSIVGMAVGDALGSQYEFGPSHPDDFIPEFGVSAFGHAPGEWTDDTSMAIPILQAIAQGESIRSADTLGWIVAGWDAWSKTAKDVGTQTRQVLARIRSVHTEESARAAAAANHEQTGRSAGNGSLMRTAPVALAYLSDGREGRLAEAAGRVAQLTHWEQDNVDATIIWCLAIRHAIRTGEIDVRAQATDEHFQTPGVGPASLDGGFRDDDRAQRWSDIIDMASDAHPRQYRHGNGWVVKAFQAAHSAVHHATDFRSAIHRAIQGGGDTDTVAAIAGALAGARWGVSGIPLSWQRPIHGWPGHDVNDLVRLAILAARRGASDRAGWPAGDSVLNPHFRHTPPVRHPHDDGVWLGSQSALAMLPPSVSAVVSLSRLGTREVPDGIESIRVWLIDTIGKNVNLEWTLADATDVIAELRAEGREVFVHCAEARSRTPAVAALYAARHCGADLDAAWASLDGRRGSGVLPYCDPTPFIRDAVARIVEAGA